MKYFPLFILASFALLIALVIPSYASALQCSAQQTTLTFTSERCYDTDGTYIGCSGNKVCQANGYCYQQNTTTTNWSCPDTTSGSCSYSSTCDESGDITTTYSFCGSSPGTCSSSSSTEYGACSRSTNGQSCGTNQVCSGGSCVTSCVSNQGQSCPSGANVCGQTNTGTIQCDGTCSASTPSNPSTCINNVGETGYQCPSGCTVTDKTLSVSVTATPSSGPAPLKNVKIDASVGGTATGTITYKLDCTNDLVFDATETSSSTSYTFTKKCDYDTPGNYTVRVNVTRQTLSVSNTTSVSTSLACDSTSFTSCSNAKDFGSGGSIGAMCGADQYYQAVVPAGNTCDVLFSVTPDSSSDYDLYVENTAAACPSTSAWDCKSTNGTGANDQCTATQLGPGAYKALVHKYSGSGIYSVASSVYNCKIISLTFPSTTWQRLWYDNPKTNNFSDASFLGETPNESSLRFDTDWGGGTLAYSRNNTVGFKSSRSITVNQSGTYQFVIGSDDGAQLYVDNSLIINQWADGSWRTSTGSVSLAAGTHNLELRYYENTGNARAFFSPAVSITVEPTAIVQGTQITLSAYCAGSACEGRTVFWNHSSSGPSPGSCVLSGGRCQTTFTTAGLGTGTVNFWGTVDISNDGDTTDAGERSADVPVTIGACAKNYDLIQDSIKVVVPIAGSTKECTVNINSSGQDLSDSSNVKYYSLPSGNVRTVEMDDDPIGAGDCDLDLKWTAFFDAPLQGKLDIESRAVEKEALQGTWPFQTPRDLSFQYNLSSSECVFTSFSPGTAKDDTSSSGENAWTNPTISTDKRAVVKKHGVKANYGSNETEKQVFSNRQFTLKECVSNDQCNPSSLNPNSDASSTKQICNIDANDNGVGDITSNFSPNTCIDSVYPSTKITGLTSSDSGIARGEKGGSVWLRGRDGGGNRLYTATAEFKDDGGAGLQTCLFALRTGTPATTVITSNQWCSGTTTTKSFTFSVGPTGDCNTQEQDNCTVWAWGIDRAQNNEIFDAYRKLSNSSQEKSYLDSSTSFTERINYLEMGVDYTPPTTQ